MTGSLICAFQLFFHSNKVKSNSCLLTSTREPVLVCWVWLKSMLLNYVIGIGMVLFRSCGDT